MPLSAQPSPLSAEDCNIQQKLGDELARFRAEPRLFNETQIDSMMASGHELLLSESSPHFRALHWFCQQAPSVVIIEVATFLIRLHAFSHPRVEQWRTKLFQVLFSCCECNRSYQEAKEKSRNTYLAAFNDTRKDAFFGSLDGWEAGVILTALRKEAHGRPLSLEHALPNAVYWILVNVFLLNNEEIFNLFSSQMPTSRFLNWPSEPPAGILLLLVDFRADIRMWAQRQVASSSLTIDLRPASNHELVLTAISMRLMTRNYVPSRPSAPKVRADNVFQPEQLWLSFHVVFNALSRASLRDWLSRQRLAGFCQFVFNHLSDLEPNFVGALRTFICIMRAEGATAWAERDPEYPVTLFDTITTNEAFRRLIYDRGATDPWLLNWIGDFLEGLWSMPTFEVASDKALKFLGEDIQDPWFPQPCRAMAAIALVSVTIHATKPAFHQAHVLAQLASTFHQRFKDGCSRQQQRMWKKLLNSRTPFISKIAFSSQFGSSAWHSARAAARTFVSTVFESDGILVKDTVALLCRARAEYSNSASKSKQAMAPSVPAASFEIPSATIHQQLWKDMYAQISNDDPDGIALLIGAVSAIAHLDALRSGKKEAFSHEHIEDQELRIRFRNGVTSVNAALEVMREGLHDTTSRFAESTEPSSLEKFVSRPNVAPQLMALMFSPVPDLCEAAKAIPLNASEVDDRLQCYIYYLHHFPGGALGGVTSFLATFNIYARIAPEACSLAKSLVRCLSDVVDALCSREYGLLFSDKLNAADDASVTLQLPIVWNMMADTLATVFECTPLWAPYYENDEMTSWMRHAISFGREMIDQLTVFGSAAAGKLRQSFVATPSKLSGIDYQMVQTMMPILNSMLGWLRLTDHETLHHTFELMMRLLHDFAKFRISPSPETLSKLEGFGRRKAGTRTQLGDDKLPQILQAIAPFSEESVPTAKNGKRKAESSKRYDTASSGDDEVRLLGELSVSRLKEKQKDKQATLGFPKAPARATLPVIVDHGLQHSKTVTKRAPAPTAQSKAMGDIKAQLRARQQLLQSGPAIPARSAKPAPKPTAPQPQVTRRVEPQTKSRPTTDASGDSDDSSDSDEAAEGLEALSALQARSPAITKKAQGPKIKRFDEGIVRDIVRERIDQREAARRDVMRLTPDLSPLHRQILCWDYDHTGDDPPPGTFLASSLSTVPDTFNPDNDHYLRTFEPLLFLECWSQLAKSKEEGQLSFLNCEINARQFVDDWVDFDATITDTPPAKWFLAETDVLLFREMGNGPLSVLGKVQSFRRGFKGIQLTFRCIFTNDKARSVNFAMTLRSNWRLSKVFSLSTAHREYGALRGLPYFDLFKDIIHPSVAKPVSIAEHRVRAAMKSYKVNEPQARAILAAFETQGFVLIQGPPGTGKTWTLCGLVGCFISKRAPAPVVVQHGRSARPTDKLPIKKILICAPSNAAIDEVTKRLKEGVQGPDGRLLKLVVVRIGPAEAIGPSVKDVSLDHLVSLKMNITPGSQETVADIPALRAEIESVARQRNQKQQELRDLTDPTRAAGLEKEVKALHAQKMALSQKIDRAKDQQKENNQSMNALRRKCADDVLSEADVICTTLSGSGHNSLDRFEFETVIIDEAAQSIEVSSLIPLKYRCKRCILVGDPQQLAPTVISLKACQFNYNQSLFVRIQKFQREAVHLLSIQYRMHPEISVLPSKVFYKTRLTDGPDMAQKTAQAWHRSALFKPYRFFNVVEGREENAHAGHSLVNREEVNIAMAIYDRLQKDFPAVSFDSRIGIVTMYRAQMLELKRQFQARYTPDILKKIDFNTVDGFQGQEKDIIILSCVRAGPGVQSVGFLADERRANVALTRCKSSLFILGHAPTLQRSNEMWKSIVQDARERSNLFEVTAKFFQQANPSLESRPISNAPQPQILPAPVGKASLPQRPAEVPVLTPRQFIKKQSMTSQQSLEHTPTVSQVPKPSTLPVLPAGLPQKPVPTQADGPQEQEPLQRLPNDAGRNPTARVNSTSRAPPPTRAPKPSAMSGLFIPKKPPKRPAENSDAGGPSNIKRRLADQCNNTRPPN